uniref:Uncharacterized protein n=1 Tax=Glossina austeni TaxID=7395 RepID=A0A1A9VRL8_GLOAU
MNRPVEAAEGELEFVSIHLRYRRTDAGIDIGKCITEIIGNEITKFMEAFVIVYGQFSENSSECSPNMFSSNNMDLSTSSSSDSEDSNRINISNGIDETTTLWNEDTYGIELVVNAERFYKQIAKPIVILAFDSISYRKGRKSQFVMEFCLELKK